MSTATLSNPNIKVTDMTIGNPDSKSNNNKSTQQKNSKNATRRNSKNKNTGDKFSIIGKIVGIRFRSPETGWAVGEFRMDENCLKEIKDKFGYKNGRTVSVVGAISVDPGDRAVLYGNFQSHPQYGEQFKADMSEIDKGVGTGLAQYIANHPDIKGIGSAKANKLVDLYGETLQESCAKDPEAVAKSIGAKVEAIQGLNEIFQQDSTLREAKFFLAEIGLTHNQVHKITEKYGWRTRQMLRENPYEMIADIDGFGFRRADDVAKKAGIQEDAECRLNAGVVYCVSEAVDHGNCWISREELIDLANKTLALNTLDAKEKIADTIDSLILRKVLVGIKTQFEGKEALAISTHELFAAEKFVKKQFAIYRDQPNPFADRLEGANISPELNEDQSEAVRTALSKTISVISGGAGVGKTYTIRQIIDIYKSVGVERILCCAPTGKAARRITESTLHEADTIHRALGYNGFYWNYNDENRLPYDLVIVDEASMIDSWLAWRLFQAIDLERTVVILIGDHNQLPPVGPGYMLRDLINNDIVSKTVLRKVVRQAGYLKESSTAILSGVVNCTPAKKSDDETLPWYVFYHTAPEKIQEFLYEIYDQYLEESFGFDIVNDVQLLTPMHKSKIGTKELNKMIQKIVQKKRQGFDVPDVDSDKLKIYIGDKVIQTKNDREIGVFNGTLGVVVEKNERKGDLYIRFEDGFERRLTPAQQKNLQLAYALTIHKAQGSEFPCVITICHNSHYIMLNRNLLYTGVTRASQVSILVGNKSGIQVAASRDSTEKRKTFLPLSF